MFYKMIENKCKEWYSSEQCTVRNLIEYIEKTGQMRDAQIEAIKVYLFLKIACECKPLEFLFRCGVFNAINLNDMELSTATRKYLEGNSAATALFEYSRLKNDKGICRLARKASPGTAGAGDSGGARRLRRGSGAGQQRRGACDHRRL